MANLRNVAPALLLWVLCLVLTSVPAKAQSTIYSEDFEDGVANGFSATGLRHVSTNTCPPTGSGAYAWAYVRDKNLGSGCNGDFLVEPCPNRPLECSPTAGSAITPSFLVPESGGRLSFVARVFSNDPNSSATFDGKWKPPIVGYDYLEVRINETPMIRTFGGGSTAVLNPSVLSSVGAFTEIDLEAFAGESPWVNFFFDSTDGV